MSSSPVDVTFQSTVAYEAPKEQKEERKLSLPDNHLHGHPVPLESWIVLFISCAGVLMASISTSALVIAFPTLLEELQCTVGVMMWILLVVMLLIGGVVGIAGKLGDVFGQAILYKFGYFIFVAGNIISGCAQAGNKGYDLLAGRVVIGFGAAFLFTNSSAILTNAFAPYNKVGLSQGIYQLTLALGIVLGPLVGGAFADTDWRWIFFWNCPVGGIAAILSLFVVRDHIELADKSFKEHIRDFDWVGAIFYPLGLALILTAMIQAVSPAKNLVRPDHLAALIICGIISGAIFVIDQFFAKDPITPPDLFLKNQIFTSTVSAGTCMAFVRNSITYNFIFYLQGPKGQSPLQAGIGLIPFGIGFMFAGFLSGALADKMDVRAMTISGPLITLVSCIVFLFFDESTSDATIGGMLFFSGLGLGLFSSPNNMCCMLSVHRDQRGVAAAVNMLTMMFTAMLGIVLTFHFVLNALTQDELYDLFIYGGSSLSSHTLKIFLKALCQDYYIVIAACAFASFVSIFNNHHVTKRELKQAVIESEADPSSSDIEHGNTTEIEMIEPSKELSSDENKEIDEIDHIEQMIQENDMIVKDIEETNLNTQSSSQKQQHDQLDITIDQTPTIV